MPSQPLGHPVLEAHRYGSIAPALCRVNYSATDGPLHGGTIHGMTDQCSYCGDRILEKCDHDFIKALVATAIALFQGSYTAIGNKS